MSVFSKAVECAICMEASESNVIICLQGHGACEDCAPSLRGHRCHSCRQGLIRTFIPNLPLNDTVSAVQTMEQELSNLNAQLHQEREARHQVELEYAQYKSEYEGLMQDVEAQLGSKRRRSERGESSTAPSYNELIGRSIEISGLKQDTAYNGKKGVIQGPHGDGGRLLVQLDNGRHLAMTRALIEQCIHVLE